ncbi:hypothetical protein CZ765_11130 [Corynebacterium casei]|nr:hypothetical protein CZ765_11130 [Corynebacterium casei]
MVLLHGVVSGVLGHGILLGSCRGCGGGGQSGSGCQPSGPASPPAPTTARRGRKFAQPSAWPRTSVSGRSEWRRSTRVPPPIGVRRNSTFDAPAGRSSLPAKPQLITTRLGGSTCRYSPRTGCPAMSTANLPPGVGSRSAYCPIQAVMPPFVIRYSNTVSGGAPMSMESRNSATRILLPRLNDGLEGSQFPRPKVVQVRAHRRQAISVNREQMARALAGADREPRLAKHSEMVRGSLLRESDLLSNHSDWLRVGTNHTKDRPPVPVHQRTQC